MRAWPSAEEANLASNAALITQYSYVLVSIAIIAASWRIIYVGKDAFFAPKEVKELHCGTRGSERAAGERREE